MLNVKTSASRATTKSPVDTRLLKERAYAALKERIVNGAFPPGAFLSERKLVEQFGMSKTPIRSALERLEAEGLVSVSPRQGIVVREPSIQEVADLFAIRMALERYVLESLAGRLTKEQIRRIKDNLRLQHQAVQEDDLAGMVQLDGDFHSLFCEFLGNREILRVIQQLRERMTLVIGLVFKRSTERMLPNWKEHTSIAEAVIGGDVEAAVARLKAHFEYGKHMLLSRP